ncbi:MAG: SUMF1/EgtB/PvdO family nonheme iron enzyme [Sorangiineae bacterium]|nr:SUMF1/EgtB/PvdO family nonheme iron enzyme [Polyangiaceae bacterium]MEB2322372.1 SUMF1/EgtB/PvdO family nonheme iron enzyme [Sorangiineae bacterium]
MNRAKLIVFSALGAGVSLIALVAVVRVAREERSEPARCPPGLAVAGARCCGGGQSLDAARCAGAPRSCAEGMHVAALPSPGCAADPHRIEYAGGELTLGPSDWEAEGTVAPRELTARRFTLDATEVTVEAWLGCVSARRCRATAVTEPGRPVTGVTPAEAARYCAFAGGRLPTGDEWLFAAMGAEARRFPWGATGLVCRRAAFGLERGPCARGATGPELAGARPDGRTPEGALDLSGNVAEWTTEPGGHFAARGGSYRSTVAAELKSWSARDADGAAPDVGFRCAYDAR